MTSTVIISEGSSDYVLLQYYLRKVCAWIDVNDKNRQDHIIKMEGQKSRLLEKQDKELTIMSAGGCSRIPHAFHRVLKRNYQAGPEHKYSYDNVIIITDRDEAGTEEGFLAKINEQLENEHIALTDNLRCNTWVSCTGKNSTDTQYIFNLLVLIIPFEEVGAMETYLLDEIAKKDAYDKEIISHARSFIEKVDPDKKYLNKRRYITKAEFDAYFCVRTPSEQFVERQNILKQIPWETYLEGDILTDYLKQL